MKVLSSRKQILFPFTKFQFLVEVDRTLNLHGYKLLIVHSQYTVLQVTSPIDTTWAVKKYGFLLYPQLYTTQVIASSTETPQYEAIR